MTPKQNIRKDSKPFSGRFSCCNRASLFWQKNKSVSWKFQLDDLYFRSNIFIVQSKVICRYPKKKLPEWKMLITSLNDVSLHYTRKSTNWSIKFIILFLTFSACTWQHQFLIRDIYGEENTKVTQECYIEFCQFSLRIQVTNIISVTHDQMFNLVFSNYSFPCWRISLVVFLG